MKIKLIDFPLKKPPKKLIQEKLQIISNQLKLQGTCSVIFSDDNFLRKLHKDYLNEDTATDVITFDLGENETEGEIYISSNRAHDQAKNFKSSYASELIRYAIHGLLHLAGFNDQTENEYLTMKKEEDKYLELYFADIL